MAAFTSELPRELWEFILDAVFDNLLLFETDPLRHFLRDRHILSKWHTQNSEDAFYRQRAALRLVCRSWRDYVDSDGLKYRYSRLWDLFIDKGPTKTQLPKAQRIAGPHFPVIVKRNRRSPYFKTGEDPVSYVQKIPAELTSAVQDGPLNGARILSTCGARLSQFVVEEYPRSFPNLEALHIDIAFWFWPGPPLEMLAHLTKSFQALVFLWLNLGTNFDFMSTDVLELHHLRSLVITASVKVGGIPYEKWTLPHLRHLELHGLKESSEMLRLIKGLSKIGNRLEVLIVHPVTPTYLKEFADIWTHCPNVKYLGVPFYGIIQYPPPPNHPLNVLASTGVNTLAYHDAISQADNLIKFVAAFMHLTVVRGSHDWQAADFDHFREGATARNGKITQNSRVVDQIATPENALVGLARATMDSPVRFEDKHGRVFGEQ